MLDLDFFFLEESKLFWPGLVEFRALCMYGWHLPLSTARQRRSCHMLSSTSPTQRHTFLLRRGTDSGRAFLSLRDYSAPALMAVVVGRSFPKPCLCSSISRTTLCCIVSLIYILSLSLSLSLICARQGLFHPIMASQEKDHHIPDNNRKTEPSKQPQDACKLSS